MESTPQHLAEQLNHDGRRVIDVLSGADFDSMHIKGSHHAPLQLLTEHTEEFAAKMGTRELLLCRSGNRTGQAQKHLNGVGLGSASALAGGVSAHAGAGGDVVNGRYTWALERHVRITAGSLVLLGVGGNRLLSPKLGLLAGGIGAGLNLSAAANTCAMGQMRSRMPWNRSASEPTARQALGAKA